MASEGPNSPGTTVDDSTVGTVAWSNVNNSQTQNDTYAGALLSSATSHYIKATNFGFSIPSGATIDGIIVEVDKYESSADAINDNTVRIVKGGTIGSTDRAGGAWPTSDTDSYTSYGSSSDLWGETWTDSDINASDFGFAISAIETAGGPVIEDNTFVDHIRITVHYTETASTFNPSIIVIS